jgi:Tol biopolymer transport system component
MLLTAGTRLGPYEIVAPLGAGGMGEVYRARDSRLNREVAVKVLPAHYAADPEWRRRLEREARSASALSHPNICAVYDIGHDDGMDFLVMEILEGETLAARLARGALPLDQALRYGSEIAAALAEAHAKGIVHRDLKPGNVMITRSGARLLDFGLAKPVAAAIRSNTEVTASAPITAHGTVVGTVQYMSPEQIEGREADARSDLFALGAVLYEMATGARAFDGRTPASIAAAILEREPVPISTRQPLAPPAFDEIVGGCLAKNPDDRWQSAHDVKLQLDALRRRSGDTAGQGAPRVASWTKWAAGAAAAALIIAAALAGRYSARPANPAPLTRLALPPPAGHSFTPNDFAISPDGMRVAFVAAGADGVSSLWVRSLDSIEPVEIRGTEGATWPFWSPDSRWIGFFTRSHLMKVQHDGAGLRTICTTEQTANGGAWGPKDQILFSREVFGPLFRVHAEGGEPAPVTRAAKETPGEAHRFPQWLPDGKRFLYVVSWTHDRRRGLYLGDVDGGSEVLISNKVRSAIVLTAGQLLYVDGESLYAQAFDSDRAALIGSPRTVLRNEIVAEWRFGEVPMSASLNGALVYQPPNNSQLVWYDRSGRELGSVGRNGYSSPLLSPDGRFLAVGYDQKGSGQTTLWIQDLERDIATEFSKEATETAHAWSADGRWIAYSTQGDLHRIRRRYTDGSQREDVLVESPGHLLVNSATNRYLVFMDFLKGPTDLELYDLDSRTSTSIATGAEGVISPDGQWVAYLNYQRGGIVLARLGTKERSVVSSEGAQVRWRRDMSELYYIADNKKMMVVPLARRDGVLVPGTPATLFQTRVVQPRLILFQYDVTADGQKFLINSLPREDAAVPLRVMLNWTRALER